MKRKATHKKGKSFNIVDWGIRRLTGLSALWPDKRRGKNIQYQIADIVKAAFAVFFTQAPSFLARQKAVQKSKGRSNAETIFQMEKIPCDEHIRQMLDPVSPEHFYGEFHAVFEQMDKGGSCQPIVCWLVSIFSSVWMARNTSVLTKLAVPTASSAKGIMVKPNSIMQLSCQWW